MSNPGCMVISSPPAGTCRRGLLLNRSTVLETSHVATALLHAQQRASKAATEPQHTLK